MVADTLQSYFLKRIINLQMCLFFYVPKSKEQYFRAYQVKSIKKASKKFYLNSLLALMILHVFKKER
ncbi:hypothetical protein BU121_10250 [Staphylococcus xylosus]|nr:hypothetical protein BU121_10250 [Staphylococcus xylosus]